MQVQPTTGVCNKLIKAWMMHTSEDAPVKAEAILRDMIAQYQRGNHAVKPNSQSFSQVMRAVGKNGGSRNGQGLASGNGHAVQSEW